MQRPPPVASCLFSTVGSHGMLASIIGVGDQVYRAYILRPLTRPANVVEWLLQVVNVNASLSLSTFDVHADRYRDLEGASRISRCSATRRLWYSGATSINSGHRPTVTYEMYI